MSLDATELLNRLRPVLTRLEADLLERTADPGVKQALAAEHVRETTARRTSDPLEVWTHFRVTQIAAAWVLSLLFVRTLEDRDLVPHRLKASDDHRAQLRAVAPYLNDRDYLLLVFRELTHYRGVRDVFDAEHNPVWTLGPSSEEAEKLLTFAKSEQGLAGLDFAGDTRFLGDVYEKLDEGVRERFALLQTPNFVETFILDRTLSPALAERGVDGLTLIDPTCGSGHFLLGAFGRLRQAWEEADSAGGLQTWAFKAVHQVYGADINPYAVAIARFRLVLAYVDAAKVRDLEDAGDLRLNVAVADSLLPVEGSVQQELAAVGRHEQRAAWGANPFAFAQGADAQRVLGGGRAFDVVVGNPPYITVKDEAKNEAYRKRYATAYRSYQLVVPFIERFFGLAAPDGWVGAIVGNGFMKREFGRKLIEEFLPTTDLTQVVDTSGAYVPGHGTPTVMLFGRHRSPASETILAVMSKRGEPTTPEDPARGLVWTSIREHHADIGFENDYISVDELDCALFHRHPWSLKGGGATKLKTAIEATATATLGSVVDVVGVAAVFREDVLFEVGAGTARRWGIETSQIRKHSAGTDVRDWAAAAEHSVIWPYSEARAKSLVGDQRERVEGGLWRWKTILAKRTAFGKSQVERGLPWFEYSMLFEKRLATPLTILFPKVATHNHFVLDRGERIFNASTHIIKLPPDTSEDDHLTLLGYLNSSLACFWMKQVFYCKGAQGVNEGLKSAAWMQFYEQDGTKIKQFPMLSVADKRLVSIAGSLDRLARDRLKDSAAATVGSVEGDAANIRYALEARRKRDLQRLRRMVGLQESLDWLVYTSYGLCPGDVVGDLAPCEPFLRATDRMVLERAVAGEDDAEAWFRVHGWDVKAVVVAARAKPPSDLEQKRIRLIGSDRYIRLLESPRFKRRWYSPDHRKQELEAIRSWLLDRIEAELSKGTATRTVRGLARTLQRNPKILAFAEILADQPAPDLERLFTELVKGDAVPYLAAHRFRSKGLEKHHAWERTWAAQRREDAGEKVDVPLPPKYGSGDFARPEFWTLRGKLDVPKERFISYPGIESEDDPTPVLGWAGWDHADRMAALGTLYENEGDAEKRVPLLAGMLELLPWVRQWHGDDDRYDTPLGEMWTGHIAGELTSHNLSEAKLRAWRPSKKTRGRKSKSGGSAKKKDGRRGDREKKSARSKKTTISRDDLINTFNALYAANADGVARKDLADQLGVSSATVGKAIKPLLDEGVWVVAKKRPILYAPGVAT